MELTTRINAFVKLGKLFTRISAMDKPETGFSQSFNNTTAERFIPTLLKAENENPWFTQDFLRLQLKALGGMLQKNKIEKWMEGYPVPQAHPEKMLTVALIMAGNIPLAGFHDLLVVLLSGNKVLARLSSKDKSLLPLIRDFLSEENNEFEDLIRFEEEKISGFDAVIATGSGNSARYFQYYFGKYPHIIRKNRNSSAILTGRESMDDTLKLSSDIFSYFGLGCRNVTKLYLPDNLDIKEILPGFEEYASLIHHHKYASNYTFHKAVKLINREEFLDNGFLLISKDHKLNSKVSCLHYESYESARQLNDRLEQEKEDTQCIVSGYYRDRAVVPFGKAQFPEPSDYADNVDSMDFLLNLNKK
jgi:hypothetical protein